MASITKRVYKEVKGDSKSPYMAAVLIRSLASKSPDVRKTCELLRLQKRHVCVVVKNNPEYRGMLKVVKDVVAYGEIDDAVFKALQEKRGQKTVDADGKKIDKPFFRLHPPVGGYERKGIKKDFRSGGALGYRGVAIKELLEKMM